MTDYANFRQRLDTALRTLDVQKVQKLLIDEKQWTIDALPADPEFSMYIMIAGSTTLRDLHERARIWLEGHGHVEEAQAMLGAGKKGVRPGDQRNAKSSGGGNRSQDQKRKGPPQGRGRPR